MCPHGWQHAVAMCGMSTPAPHMWCDAPDGAAAVRRGFGHIAAAGDQLVGTPNAMAMRAMIAWGEKHLPEEERVGYIDKQHKAGDSCDDPLEMPLKWKDQES